MSMPLPVTSTNAHDSQPATPSLADGMSHHLFLILLLWEAMAATISVAITFTACLGTFKHLGYIIPMSCTALALAVCAATNNNQYYSRVLRVVYHAPFLAEETFIGWTLLAPSEELFLASLSKFSHIGDYMLTNDFNC
jgi:hypothetical protein